MYNKKDNTVVDIYHFNLDDTVTVYSSHLAARQNGNGWTKLKLKNLIPLDYYDEEKKGYMSKIERNKIKERLTLTSAIWTCTDGASFSNCNEAISHEYKLFKEEEK
jgi:hypothetical protein